MTISGNLREKMKSGRGLRIAMIVGEIRNQIDSIWNDFWSGGLSNPLSVMEQITYLLFIKRLDELQTNEERKAAMLRQPLVRRIFPEGRDGRGHDERVRKLGWQPYEDLRWSAKEAPSFSVLRRRDSERSRTRGEGPIGQRKFAIFRFQIGNVYDTKWPDLEILVYADSHGRAPFEVGSVNWTRGRRPRLRWRSIV